MKRRNLKATVDTWDRHTPLLTNSYEYGDCGCEGVYMGGMWLGGCVCSVCMGVYWEYGRVVMWWCGCVVVWLCGRVLRVVVCVIACVVVGGWMWSCAVVF